ncbi:MAG: TRIC cation channel family protein [Pseudomonadota bacterium]
MGLWLALLWLPAVGGVQEPGAEAAASAVSEGLPDTLRSGWFVRPPYQFRGDPSGLGPPTGLDIRIAEEALDGLGHHAEFSPMAWDEQLEALRSGNIDFVVGTYHDPARLDYVRYSRPYREERNALYVRADSDWLRDFPQRADFVDAVRRGDFHLGVTAGYAYASPDVARMVADPGPDGRLRTAADDEGNLRALMDGRIDGFVADPVIVDLMLAETGQAGRVRAHALDLGTVGVRVMFARATIPPEFVERFDDRLQAMEDSRRIANLEVEHILPAFLAMATSETWFKTLTLLGILAFSASGVMLARRERYNLFGALVLAALPAIGGGVLRDLLLGREPIFIFETPEFLLMPVAVVLVGFALYKFHDHFLVYRQGARHLILQQQAGWGGRVVGNLQRGLDAWAVASFTVIGVGMAVESQASPLWLWGPVMAVVTASFGVIMRDVVRSDFNIDMLKRDSFAEISVLGGILYSLILLWPPVELSLTFILVATNAVIVLLFGLRLLILYSGRVNPLQMGDPHTLPERRLEWLEMRERERWGELSGYLGEDAEGHASPVPPAELEGRHKDFEYALQPLLAELDLLAGEPLFEAAVVRHQALRERLRILVRLEQQLYDYLREAGDHAGEGEAAQVANSLETRVLEGLRSLLDTVAFAVADGEREELEWLREMTSNQRNRFDALRTRYLQHDAMRPGGPLDRVLQRTHRVERMMWLLADYVEHRLEPPAEVAGNDRRRRQQQRLRDR